MPPKGSAQHGRSGAIRQEPAKLAALHDIGEHIKLNPLCARF